MAEQKSQAQAASDLAAFLTTPRRTYDGRGKTPLEAELEAQITTLTRQIAAQVIAGTPELVPHVKRMVEQTIRRALSDDPWLAQTVIDAVSKAITDVALERHKDDEA